MSVVPQDHADCICDQCGQPITDDQWDDGNGTLIIDGDQVIHEHDECPVSNPKVSTEEES